MIIILESPWFDVNILLLVESIFYDNLEQSDLEIPGHRDRGLAKLKDL